MQKPNDINCKLVAGIDNAEVIKLELGERLRVALPGDPLESVSIPSASATAGAKVGDKGVAICMYLNGKKFWFFNCYENMKNKKGA